MLPTLSQPHEFYPIPSLEKPFSIVKSFSSSIPSPPPPPLHIDPFNLKPFSLGVIFRHISGKVVINVFLILVCIILILMTTWFLSAPLNHPPPDPLHIDPFNSLIGEGGGLLNGNPKVVSSQSHFSGGKISTKFAFLFAPITKQRSLVWGTKI